MEQLKRKVRAVRRRLLWLRFLHLTLVGLFWLSILAALTLVAGRLVLPIDDETAWQSWTHLAVAGLLALCVPVGVLGALLGRLTLFHAAVEADGRLGLKERISSAILLRGARRPMEELLEADAVVAAQHIRPRRDFPFTPPRTLRWLPVPVFALVITALLLDQHNLLAGSQAPTPEERAELTLAREENQDEAQRLEELATLIEETASSSSSPEHFAELRRELEQIAENLREADASRLEEVADLSNLADQAAQQREAAERRLEQTSGFAADPSAQRTAGLQQAMQEGDFERAREMLQELAQEIQQEMASGEMTAEQLEQLADEIERMAEQMGENSETGQQLAQAAQAMRQAAQASREAGQQQGQQGQANSGQAAGQAAQAMAQANQAMQQAMSQMSEAMSDLADAQEQLAIAEALEQDLNAARASLARNPGERRAQQCQACRSGEGQCQGGTCRGQGNAWRLSQRSGAWRAGETNRQGSGTGGPGQGRGGRPPESDGGDTAFRDEALSATHLPGVIIAEMEHHDGVQVEGESTVAVSDVFLTYEQRAEQTLETEVIPAGYRGIARDYFTAIHPVQRVREGEPSGPEAPPAQP